MDLINDYDEFKKPDPKREEYHVIPIKGNSN